MLGSSLGVYAASLVLVDKHVAVSVKRFGRELQPPLEETSARKERDIWSLLVTVGCLECKSVIAGVARHHVDDASKRIGAIKIRSTALHDLDSFYRLTRNTSPVNPSSEWIVDRNPVRKHDRAACST